jgi:hypothetical protein
MVFAQRGLGAGGFRTGSRPSFLRAEEVGQPLDAHTGVDPGQTRRQLASHLVAVRRLRCDGVFG